MIIIIYSEITINNNFESSITILKFRKLNYDDIKFLHYTPVYFNVIRTGLRVIGN